jgi:signal recognition particle subunit SRP54
LFDALSERLTSVLARLRSRGTLSEADVAGALREIRIALLEADVHYQVAKELVASIRERAVGTEVLDSLSPGQQVIKIVRDALTDAMGGERRKLELDRRPSVVLLVGLQGSGKTTTTAKLATALAKEGRKPVLAACDVQRPAAIDQLEALGHALDLPVVARVDPAPSEIAKAAVEWAKTNGRDVVLIDTAGRLQIDEGMMVELEGISAAVEPEETLLVVDAMTGQEAVGVASAFDERIGLTGIILAKLDGDARGGAALSIRHVTGKPVVYVGTGEKTDRLEAFHPGRMADRILGMGDVLSLIEEAEERLDQEKAEELVERIRKERFTLQDFLEQIEEMQKLGPVSQILERLPGSAKVKARAAGDVEELEMRRTLAILRSMTLKERLNPSIIGGSRKKRIARGSGTKVRDVNRVLSRFEDAKRALKRVGGRRGKGRLPADLLGNL